MSGIYIHGMEMPNKKNGAVLIIYPDGKCAFEDGKTYQAVPVPPHGDLIDRDALPWENQGFMLTDPDEWGLKVWDIEHAPTIIPAEPPKEK